MESRKKIANSYVKLHIADFEFQFNFIDQWEFQDPKMGYCTIFQAIFFGDIPWNLGLTNRPFFYGIGTSILHRFRRWIHQSHGLKKCANVTGTAQGFYHYKSHQKKGADLSSGKWTSLMNPNDEIMRFEWETNLWMLIFQQAMLDYRKLIEAMIAGDCRSLFQSLMMGIVHIPPR